ncbi:hypothetical protein [Enterocloster citroniae]|uniref:hypothetical protein n=1 Tax=Enterocloster citroniae TaxID=358743 RepID=UPI00058FC80C|nr:hypothetical protein [Enterocloster citroniae]MCC3387102.1 hypothetical protein [Enterocloster citroniae]
MIQQDIHFVCAKSNNNQYNKEKVEAGIQDDNICFFAGKIVFGERFGSSGNKDDKPTYLLGKEIIFKPILIKRLGVRHKIGNRMKSLILQGTLSLVV